MATASDLEHPGPARPTANSSVAGDAASPEALARLRKQLAGMQATKQVQPLLNAALAQAKSGNFAKALEGAERALKKAPDSYHCWHLLAICREKLGDWSGSIEAYEKALAFQPDSPEIANDLGRLAYRMGMLPQAEALFRFHLSHRLGSEESSNNLASVLRTQMRYDEAIDVLKTAIQLYPNVATLWNTLGTVLSEMGDMAQAEVFYAEALRLDPNFALARYNRANAIAPQGRGEEAIAECAAAAELAELADDRGMMRLSHAYLLLSNGRLAEGWDAYEARLSPDYVDSVTFRTEGPRWKPEEDLAGKSLLLFGEQGLGDEVLFANVVDDVIDALGPAGRLTLAVAPRLVSLFQRSFPRARVGPHATLKRGRVILRGAPFVTDWSEIDLWAPLADPLKVFRRSVEAFPNRPEGFLRADPERVAHWRRSFAHLPGPKVGLLWTSMLVNSMRQRYYAPFQTYEPLFRTPGLTFVNLQYGDCAAEMAYAKQAFGVEIVQPEGIDLKMDLDDVAALSRALDVVVGPPNATSNLAAACGGEYWTISSPEAWPRLGTDRYPWYPQAKVFIPTAFGAWEPLMNQIASELAALARRGTPQAAVG